jgi:hypothetical protein
MNLLEHYIIEVKKVTEFNDEWVEVEVLCNCWGDERVLTHFATKTCWQRELEQGYFMA